MAADYDLTNPITKRLRFFDGQFLQDQDFIDEQRYNLDRRRRHLRHLAAPGICEGLTIAPTEVPFVAQISPGTALDAEGRQIVLAAPEELDLSGAQGGVRYVAIRYVEAARDPSGSGRGTTDETRWSEEPRIHLFSEAEWRGGVADPQTAAAVAASVLLGVVTVAGDGSGALTTDASQARYAGLRLPSPGAAPPSLRSGGSQAPGLARLAGDLSITGQLGVGTAQLNKGLVIDRDALVDLIGDNAPAEIRSSGGAWGVSLVLRTLDLPDTDAPSILFRSRDTKSWQVRAEHAGLGFQITEDGGDAEYGDGPGTPRLHIAPGGSVGIGTTEPGADRLAVEGTARISQELVVRGRVGIGTAQLNKGLVIDRDGLVDRIGDNAPVEIRSSGGAWGIGLVLRTLNIPDTDAPAILFRSRDTKSWQVRAEHAGLGFQITEGGGDAQYGDGPGEPRLHIAPGGDVGLGTTDPESHRLRVAGSARIDESLGIGRSADTTYRLRISGDARLDGRMSINAGINTSYRLVVNGTTSLKNVDLGSTNRINWGRSNAQKLNLWDGVHGIGVQSSVTYFRSSVAFGFFLGGSHNDAPLNPGSGGALIYFVDPSGGHNASDGRFKREVKPLTDALTKVSALRGVQFRWLPGPGREGLEDALNLGFIAQEVAEVVPEAVTITEAGDHFLNYTMLVPLLAEAIKEQQRHIEALEARLRP